jgi:hypothetical protein
VSFDCENRVISILNLEKNMKTRPQLFPYKNNSATLDDFELKFRQIANSIMLFHARVIISLQKREFPFMKVVNIHDTVH